jgi:uncharacterized repeat protein (TIGR04138 family)
MESKLTIEQIAREDGRYDPRALRFIYEGLGSTISALKGSEVRDQSRHISGDELAKGLADLASERWGRLAGLVLNLWGVHSTRDMGEIVYLMISNEWMTARDTDRIEDFDNVFDFEERFERGYRFDFKRQVSE